MTAFPGSYRLLLVSLLLAASACHRASYPAFQPVAPLVLTTPVVAPVPPAATAARPNRLARIMARTAAHRQRRQSARPAAVAAMVTRAAAQVRQPAARLALQPAARGTGWRLLRDLIGTMLLVLVGVVLLMFGSGWLVGAGIVLLLLAAVVTGLYLEAARFGRGFQH